MTKVIAIANRKGGVAKTTSTVNLAQALIHFEKRVLVVDVDPQASLTDYYINDPEAGDALEEEHKTLYWGLRNGGINLSDLIIRENPSLLPSSIMLSELETELLVKEWGAVAILRKKIQPLTEHFDYLILDCPPTYGLLTINALTAADGVVIPVKTDLMSIRGIPLLLDTIAKVQDGPNERLHVIGVLPTLYKPHNLHDKGALERVKQIFEPRNIPVFEPINHSTSYDKSVGEGRSALLAYPDTPGVENYYKLAEYIIHHA